MSDTDEITVSEAWLRSTMSKAFVAASFVGACFGALAMFIVCHFRWELLR